jgi:Skp family chaperone for outer membrane proteins
MIGSFTTRVLAILAALALPLAAHAQPAPAPSAAGFLVMDTGRLATEAKAMQSVFDQIARRRDVEAAAYNMALDKLDKEFEPVRQARATMDPAEYQKAAEQYDGIRRQIDDVLAKTQAEMNAAGEKAIETFNAAATSVGDEIRKERGVARFIDGASVLYIRPGSPWDVTDEAIRRVNAKLPDIKVNFPARPKAEQPKPAAKKK